MKRIESLLSREIGLNPASIGASAIDAAIKTRLRDTGLVQLADYVQRLERSPEERRALIEEIVVSETWFFRDEEVFKALARHALPIARRDRVVRVLSLPCATGEEAYSVAIALLASGLSPTRFQVRAVDVSERALAHARRGRYGKGSFRGTSAQLHPGYFEAKDGGTALTEPPRSSVTFALGNVLDSALFEPRSFDVVLCRNLLIYLDPAARTRALSNIWNWLREDGLLFAGHAEAIELMDARFARQAEAAPFGYVKQSRERAEAPGKRAPERKLPPVVAKRTTGSGATAKAPKAELTPASLARATELADAGRLQEARAVCLQYINEASAGPKAYCLLGLIHKVQGEVDAAIDCFNKSLYLDPGHQEALIHLALLHEQRGDSLAAANFRRRAERARRGEGA
ncbi:MAG: methylase of chemotaxis methyl-accepting protein [Polyangiaceae bacterium]|nr:methylase of chemotaxis methyl-accepting protein [Polyangiaceae bacterium]